MVVYHDRNLIINYIPRNVSDLDLSNLFSTVGTIKTCRIIRDRNSGSSFGFGFCEYEDAESAHKAIARFNGYRIADKVLKVSLAKLQGRLYQSSNLYVKNFPVTVTEEQLCAEFERFGKVLQCRILRDRDSDASKGSAYVLFENRSDAEIAKKSMDGAPWPGSGENLVLSIKFATPPYRQPPNTAHSNKSTQPRKADVLPNSFTGLNYGDQLAAQILALQSRGGFTCDSLFNAPNQPYLHDSVYLSQGNNMIGTVPSSTIGIPGHSNTCGIVWPPEYVNSEGRPVLATPLNMTSAYSPQFYISQYPWMFNQWSSLPSTVSSGIGSVYPGALEGFTNAVHGCPVFTGLTPPVFTPTVTLNGTQNNVSRIAPTENASKRVKHSKAEKASTSVYVYNIGNLMTNTELCGLFGRFGPVSCVSIPRDPKTNFARNFGFVTFENFKGAANAVAAMNGFSYGGRRLQVSFRKPRPGTAKGNGFPSKPVDKTNGTTNEPIKETVADSPTTTQETDIGNEKIQGNCSDDLAAELNTLDLNATDGHLAPECSPKPTT